ncbi:hypothetical protein PCANC_04488 [Puccinia coronata f. sp. avenae]|uniref:Uncharacterized protein n=1 Tax=Puccinia coronata f. sp. avenae TaxID=200324 RepID=A0A2N5UP56_9BASI|nr:hypothetical protein PCANC_08768 [Puccinia coronata f. sp. avenae]PLW39553.1 hypothetical protein PCASD_07687 [Puccinia coronata f. sp. avenae]PLW53709.1 hypothetical protein PCANC_04488 [Puccinia coronata f. sp. avenae]
MSTRQNPNSTNVPFVNNPESILRAANAARQRAAAAASRAALQASVRQGQLKNRPAAPTTPTTTPSKFQPMATHDASGIPARATSSSAPESTQSDQKWRATSQQHEQPTPDADFLRMILESQHNGILLAQQERAATAEHMTRMEEASAERIT